MFQISLIRKYAQILNCESLNQFCYYGSPNPNTGFQHKCPVVARCVYREKNREFNVV